MVHFHYFFFDVMAFNANIEIFQNIPTHRDQFRRAVTPCDGQKRTADILPM